MKISEIIINEEKLPKMHNHYADPSGRVDLFTDPDLWDRTHHLDRVMRAAASLTGVPELDKDAIKTDTNGWAGKYNSAHPYSEPEHAMLDAAYKMVGTRVRSAKVDGLRKENDEVNKTSPVRAKKKNRYGV
jgi:hypothetical protein